MSSLIWFPNSWMCNKQLIHCFTLCITVKFKKNTGVNSVTLTACESRQAGYNKMYASCVSYCRAHHSNPLWYKQYFTTHAHSDTTPHKQEIYLLCLKYLVLSARPFLLPKATERWKTARHAAAATTTTTRPPESEGRRAVQDSTRPSQSPHSDTQKRWFQREREREAATAVVPEQRKQQGEAGFSSGSSQKTGCSMNSVTGGGVPVVMGASPFQGWVMHHFENDEMTGLWKPARHTVLLVTLQTDSVAEGGVGLRLGVGPLFVIWAA